MSFLRSTFFVPPAIIQSEIRSIENLAAQCANGYKATLAQATCWIENHNELHRRYQEKWATWDECCHFVYGCTRQAVHKKLLSVTESFGQPEVDSSNLDAKSTQAEIAKLPDPISVPPKSTQSPGQALSPDNQEPRQTLRPETPKPPTDLSGAVVPQGLLPLVDRKSEVTQIEFYASKLHAFFQSVQKEQDPLWRKLRGMATIQTFTTSAQAMQWAIRECCPEVVCPGCGAGSKQPACLTCEGTGMISEVRWNRDWVKSTDKAKQAIVMGRNHA